MTDWIRTADELPPPDERVLVWFNGTHHMGAFHSCGPDLTIGWWDVGGSYTWVTPVYWQPLPPRPYMVSTIPLVTLGSIPVESREVLFADNPPTRIYSREHTAYWRRVGDSKGGNGYVSDARDAGIWPFTEAFEAVRGAGPEKGIVLEVMFPA